MVIRRVSATVLFVDDLVKCTTFYRDVLGLQATFSDSESVAFRTEDQDFVLLKVPAAVNMISAEAVGQDRGGRQRVLLCAEMENVDEAYQSLMAKGISFIKPPIDQPWGRRTTYFADPEGNLWELFQFLDTNQPQ